MSKRPADHFVEIGVVGRPHGVRGEVRIFLHHSSSNLIAPGRRLRIAVGDEPPTFREVALVRRAAKHLIVALDGVTTRDDSALLKGGRVLVPRDELPEIDSDEFYVDDLVGMDVYCGEQRIGRIVSSRAQGGIEVVQVLGEAEEIEIPLVDQYVEQLDLGARRLTVGDLGELPRTPRSNRSGREE